MERYNFLQESQAQMFSAGITREQRCTLEKCNAYCAKKVFMTCRETQYTQQCEKSNPRLYGCDVNCNLAARHFRLGAAVLLLVLKGFL